MYTQRSLVAFDVKTKLNPAHVSQTRTSPGVYIVKFFINFYLTCISSII
jgi:hypothetical protein